MSDFRIVDLVGIPFLRGSSTRTGADCWGLGEILFLEGRGIVLPAYNVDVRYQNQRASIRAVRASIAHEVRRAWRRLEEGEAALPYDAVVWGDHIAWVSEDPLHILSTSEELKSSYLRKWPEQVAGVYRYVGPS